MDVETETLSAGEIEERIPATGTIRPAIEVKLAPEVSGEVVEVFFNEGDTVMEGEALVKIRQDQYLSQVEQAQASLGSLRAQLGRQRAELQQARMNHERDKKLYELSAISTAEFQASATSLEIARNTLREAEYSIRSGESRLKEALENLQKTTVYAPMTGIVSRINVEKGEIVVGTNQMAGTELCRIADFSRMEIEVNVGENDIVRISANDSARIEIDAYPRQEFKGIVTYIANSAKNNDGRFDQVRNFAVRIEITPDSAKFLPGMSAAVSIITDQKNDCLSVPLGSVFYRGKEASVWTVDHGGVCRRRLIETGIQGMDRIEVKSGLDAGETVVIGPPEAISHDLAEGKRVRVKQN